MTTDAPAIDEKLFKSFIQQAFSSNMNSYSIYQASDRPMVHLRKSQIIAKGVQVI
jgi:hypothetical protein